MEFVKRKQEVKEQSAIAFCSYEIYASIIEGNQPGQGRSKNAAAFAVGRGLADAGPLFSGLFTRWNLCGGTCRFV